MHHPTDRITHTTAFVTPVVEHWLERYNNVRLIRVRAEMTVRRSRQRRGLPPSGSSQFESAGEISQGQSTVCLKLYCTQAN